MPKTYTPLRYPGGKSQLYNFIKKQLDLNSIKNGLYIEPFSGGAGLAIKLLLLNDVHKIIINDLDPSIHAFWHCVLTRPDDLINKIESTDITIEEWQLQRKTYNEQHDDSKSLDNAFATFFLNRTNRSGIINGGPIGGYEQNGKYKIDCRFNKEDLIRKISDIASRADDITLYNFDAVEFIKQKLHTYTSTNTFCFFDPPYYMQGKKLYKNAYNAEDHQLLHDQIITLTDLAWITTYDNEDLIAEMYSDCKRYQYTLNYSAQSKRRESEYLFTNNHTIIESHERVDLTEIK